MRAASAPPEPRKASTDVEVGALLHPRGRGRGGEGRSGCGTDGSEAERVQDAKREVRVLRCGRGRERFGTGSGWRAIAGGALLAEGDGIGIGWDGGDAKLADNSGVAEMVSGFVFVGVDVAVGGEWQKWLWRIGSRRCIQYSTVSGWEIRRMR